MMQRFTACACLLLSICLSGCAIPMMDDGEGKDKQKSETKPDSKTSAIGSQSSNEELKAQMEKELKEISRLRATFDARHKEEEKELAAHRDKVERCRQLLAAKGVKMPVFVDQDDGASAKKGQPNISNPGLAAIEPGIDNPAGAGPQEQEARPMARQPLPKNEATGQSIEAPPFLRTAKAADTSPAVPAERLDSSRHAAAAPAANGAGRTQDRSRELLSKYEPVPGKRTGAVLEMSKDGTALLDVGMSLGVKPGDIVGLGGPGNMTLWQVKSAAPMHSRAIPLAEGAPANAVAGDPVRLMRLKLDN